MGELNINALIQDYGAGVDLESASAGKQWIKDKIGQLNSEQLDSIYNTMLDETSSTVKLTYLSGKGVQNLTAIADPDKVNFQDLTKTVQIDCDSANDDQKRLFLYKQVKHFDHSMIQQGNTIVVAEGLTQAVAQRVAPKQDSESAAQYQERQQQMVHTLIRQQLNVGERVQIQTVSNAEFQERFGGEVFRAHLLALLATQNLAKETAPKQEEPTTPVSVKANVIGDQSIKAEGSEHKTTTEVSRGMATSKADGEQKSKERMASEGQIEDHIEERKEIQEAQEGIESAKEEAADIIKTDQAAQDEKS